MPRRFNTASNARAALATLMRKREKSDIDDADYRALVYGLSQLLGYFKHIDDLKIEGRLDAIETRLQEIDR